MSGQIAKNTIFLTLAYIGQKIFSFVYFSLIARFMGVDNVGLYVTALSFSSLFSIFGDLGLTQVLIREGSRDKTKLSNILSQTVIIKIILSVLAYLILNLLVYFLGYKEELRNLIWLAGILMIIDSLTLSFYGVLRALENLRYEALGVVMGQIIIVIFGLAVVFLRLPVAFLFLALGVGSLFNAIFSFTILYKKGIKLNLIWQKDLIFRLSRLTLPFALAGIFTKIYSYIDSILISFLTNTKNVGFYSIPNKVVFAFQFIPMAFAASIYPAMSKYFFTDKTKLKQTFEKSFTYLLILSAPLAVGMFIIADIFINSVYGWEYGPSIKALQILTIGLIFAFLDFPVGALLNACNKQNIQTWAMGIAMSVNIILNLILIPFWGINGASFSAVISNFILLAIGFLWVPSIIGKSQVGFWFKNIKILIVSVVMGALLFKLKFVLLALSWPVNSHLKPALFLLILIFTGGVFYGLTLWITKILSKEEILDLIFIFKRKKYESA